jgi:hypothetical protein
MNDEIEKTEEELVSLESAMKIIIVSVIAVAMIFCAFIAAANAHSWYDYGCCSDKDCKLVDEKEIDERPDAVYARMPDGTWKSQPHDIVKITRDPENRPATCVREVYIAGKPKWDLICIYVPRRST